MNIKKTGFSFVEMIIVLAIVIVLVGVLIATLNPIAQIRKGQDATRKKDLKKISIAFEEYYNDHGCYPSQAMIDALACGSRDFYQLSPWPCDPRGGRYNVLVNDSQCSAWFTVVTRLTEEGEDRQCNYGVASTNKDWREENECYDVIITPTEVPDAGVTSTPTPAFCCVPGTCHKRLSGSACNASTTCSVGENCYLDGSSCPGSGGIPCVEICKVSSCGQ